MMASADLEGLKRLAGLTVAHALATQKKRQVEVELFERSDRLGLDAASVEVPIRGRDGKASFHLDTPMRAVQGGYYRSVLRLYEQLGVRLKVADFNYSFLRSEPELRASFIYEGGNGLRWQPIGLPSSLLPQRSAPPTATGIATLVDLARYLFLCIMITLGYLQLVVLAGLHHHARRKTPLIAQLARTLGVVDERAEERGGETLGAWCRRWNVPDRLRAEVVEPLFCCVCTCSRQDVRAYPAADILDYIWLTFGAKHYVCADGVASVVAALTAPLPAGSIHTGPAGSIVRLTRDDGGGGSGSRWTLETAAGRRTTADHIVFATQANHALALLAPTSTPSTGGRDAALARFEYATTLVVNHSDAASVLPVGPETTRDLRDLNILLDDPNALPEDASRATTPTPTASSGDDAWPPPYDVGVGPRIREPGYVMATHVLTRTHADLVPLLLGGGGGKTATTTPMLLQTTNPTVDIDRTKVVSETWFERAKVTVGSRRALRGFHLPDDELATAKGEEKDEEEGSGKWQGLDGVWFCGSWCAEGIPLLEGCVVSAERVALALLRSPLSAH